MLHFEIHWSNTDYTCIAIMIAFVNWLVSTLNSLYRGNLVYPSLTKKSPPPFSLFMLHFEIHWPNTGYTCIAIMNAFVNWQVSSFNCLYRGNLVRLPLTWMSKYHPGTFYHSSLAPGTFYKMSLELILEFYVLILTENQCINSLHFILF